VMGMDGGVGWRWCFVGLCGGVGVVGGWGVGVGGGCGV